MTFRRPDEPVAFWAEWAYVSIAGIPSLYEHVVITVSNGRITHVDPGVAHIPFNAITLAGLTLPGLANTHSRAFQRRLRSVPSGTASHDDHRGAAVDGWQEAMYLVANELTPESYAALAADVFTEMLHAGYTTVGEFHYLHHEPDGRPYDDRHAMELAIIEAAQSAGIRLTLLDTCFLRSGFRSPTVTSQQRRFSDRSVEEWEARVENLARFIRGRSTVRLGAGIDSVRTVGVDDAAIVARWARTRSLPLHAHVSEFAIENEQASRFERSSPTELLFRAGVDHPDVAFTAVHGTRLSVADIRRLGTAHHFLATCPTTDRDLGTGIAPTDQLASAGVRLCLGSGGNAVINPFEEMRAMELNQRVTTGRRGIHSTVDLLTAGSATGYQSLGWHGGGTIQPGALADFVSLSLGGDRLKGIEDVNLLSGAVFAASQADVHHVVVNGEIVVRDGVSTRRPQRI
jgi:formiminoglutamate deiminase